MHRGFIRLGALLAGLAVILGAFGAHGLKPLLSEQELATFETAVRYQFYHAIAILIAGILYAEFANSRLKWTGRLFGYGIFIFSGSLYGLTLLRLAGRAGFEWLGAIAPLGGTCFVIGWLLMLLAVVRKN